MKTIRAFVGHSFNDDDAEVVGRFKHYFDTLEKNPNLGFSWESAQDTGTETLDKKVLRLIENKTLFIGICTKHEQAIEKKSKTFFGYLTAKKRDFTWKTSDWIIQEIGLSKGKGMNLILLQESGIRINIPIFVVCIHTLNSSAK